MPELTTSPDAELLAACAAFHAVFAREWSPEVPFVSDEETNRVAGLTDAARDRVSALCPTTPEGIKAKARVVHTVFKLRVASFDPTADWADADAEEALVITFLGQLAGSEAVRTA